MVFYRSGDIIKAKVTAIKHYGAFIQTKDGTQGLIHISEIDNSFIVDINYYLKVGEIIEVKVLSFRDGRINASLNFNKNRKKILGKNNENLNIIQFKYGFETLKNNLELWQKKAEYEIRQNKK
ncbi:MULTISPECIES: S1 RNA-binding domain-containing protein [unclassified Gemella]|uniref:S1 RNA-binding domain-containing protein n=1 Tax=unclassified Gemella TaxID=2624949 RepID=UPI001C05AAB1|nr:MULTISPECIES: S1 RNA-binding domain-containing protein [unclassified Gemella]MBU0278032.1 S1 RNA-binding domain-containing protein [Gemella sp. zg-1178]QWQ38438.1 S1 RNA-binding domain-containing protein [Gemella sp. zg-570]